jgi:pyridoxine 5-phosphate synthase
MATLGVNVDHIATIRQARGGHEPDPVHAAALAEIAGAKGITAHLREDRRHIQDRDIYILKQTVATHLNLEMAVTEEMVKLAVDVLPFMVTLVPEKRQELTTEGGLAVREQEKELAKAIETFRNHNILVSLFIIPELNDIKSAKRIGATHVELHTGPYANSAVGAAQDEQLEQLKNAALFANRLGLHVNAGHGLNYRNVTAIARMNFIEELNIGHSIISRAALVGLDQAVRDMIAQF